MNYPSKTNIELSLVEDITLKNDNFFDSNLTDKSKIDVKEILYCFSHKSGTLFFQSDESFTFHEKDLANCQNTLLKGLNFSKINVSYLVNLEHVVGVLQIGNYSYCELKNGELLMISKRNLPTLQKILVDRV